jgi:very-short-patch-repair endonuclease
MVEADELTGDWITLFQKCESPIEKLMCLAFFDTEGRITPMLSNYSWDDVENAGNKLGLPVTMLWGQQKILAYRVDFMIARYNPETWFSRRLVIECDGHEFHSSFAMQRYDAIRDRAIKPFVGGIVRITGSEIYRSAQSIAWNILWAMEMDDTPKNSWRRERK